MIGEKTLLLAIGPDLHENERARAFRHALAIDAWLGGRLVVVLPSLDCLPTRATLVRSSRAIRRPIDLLAMRESWNGAPGVLEIASRAGADLLLLAGTAGWFPFEDRSAPEAGGAARPWEIELMEKAKLPILLLPEGAYHRTAPPYRSILVPMSAERRLSQALEWAIDFGNDVHLPVDVIHVSLRGRRADTDTPVAPSLGEPGDQGHREYPGQLEEFIAKACPYHSIREKQVIRDFIHRAGEPLQELTRRVATRMNALIVLEWSGELRPGRARLIKGILKDSRQPILLLRDRSLRQADARLKVGDRFAS